MRIAGKPCISPERVRPIFNAENLRMLVILAFVSSAYVLMKSQMKEMGHSLNKRIDGLDHKIDVVELSLGRRMDGLEASINELRVTMNGRIDGVEASLIRRMDDLKHNDFAHLNSTIEALTYALEKNGSLKREDKEYIDSRLATV